MKKLIVIAILLLGLPLGGLYIYFHWKIKFDLKPTATEEATEPLRLAGLELELPKSWTAASYKNEIWFLNPKESGPSPNITSGWLTLLERPYAGEPETNFQPDLFPDKHQQPMRQTVPLTRLELTAPAGFDKPFKAEALLDPLWNDAQYAAAVDMGGYILHLYFMHRFSQSDFSQDRAFHSAYLAEQMTKVDGIYSRSGAGCSERDLLTRFGCLRQKPDSYWLRQSIYLETPSELVSGLIMTRGECGNDPRGFCRSQLFEIQPDPGALSWKLIDLISGYYGEMIESGPRDLGGLKARACVNLRYNVLPWGMDGESDALSTDLRVLSGHGREALLIIGAEDWDKKRDQATRDEFNRAYGDILKIWASIKAAGSAPDASTPPAE